MDCLNVLKHFFIIFLLDTRSKSLFSRVNIRLSKYEPIDINSTIVGASVCVCSDLVAS